MHSDKRVRVCSFLNCPAVPVQCSVILVSPLWTLIRASWGSAGQTCSLLMLLT